MQILKQTKLIHGLKKSYNSNCLWEDGEDSWEREWWNIVGQSQRVCVCWCITAYFLQIGEVEIPGARLFFPWWDEDQDL